MKATFFGMVAILLIVVADSATPEPLTSRALLHAMAIGYLAIGLLIAKREFFK